MIIHGDCLEVMRGMPDCSVDAVVTDPPYGLAFMNKRWDYDVPTVEVWAECLRVLKPGGHLLCFAGTRTHHRMCCRIEDAGFEIRDMIAWVYGSGFPKSLDVSKAIDKAAGASRDKIRTPFKPGLGSANTVGGDSRGEGRPWIDRAAEVGYHEHDGPDPVTDAAKQWQGWGTALKPSVEPITVARKPLAGTVAQNVLEWGTGALNIDGCRVGEEHRYNPPTRKGATVAMGSFAMCNGEGTTVAGRWPANLIHDGSDEATEPLGSAARFFYCAKASKKDRDAGMSGPLRQAGAMEGRVDGSLAGNPVMRRNHHPTVKPTELMRYLVRLVTPPGGTVLDPFCGSGSTGKACVLEGFEFIGIEREAEYVEIARARIEGAAACNPMKS